MKLSLSVWNKSVHKILSFSWRNTSSMGSTKESPPEIVEELEHFSVKLLRILIIIFRYLEGFVLFIYSSSSWLKERVWRVLIACGIVLRVSPPVASSFLGTLSSKDWVISGSFWRVSLLFGLLEEERLFYSSSLGDSSSRSKSIIVWSESSL